MILKSASFTPDAQGHGGARRILQIVELLEGAGHSIVDACGTRSFSRWQRVAAVARMLWKTDFSVVVSPQQAGLVGEFLLNYEHSLKMAGVDLLLWEDTRRLFVPYLARAAGVEVIALPQNIESLVGGLVRGYFFGDRHTRWRQELRALKQATKIFCISREEQWLLNNWGLQADFLPYFPPKEAEAELLSIRAARQPDGMGRFLVVGSALNPPTRQGLAELLQVLKIIRETFVFGLDVAGFGTEVFASQPLHPDFRLHGPVSQMKLRDLMVGSTACLVYQPLGVGALTRIPEMLMAGLPVIANPNACRSWWGMNGLHVFEDREGLAALMRTPLQLPDIPARDFCAEHRFLQAVNTLRRGAKGKGSTSQGI